MTVLHFILILHLYQKKIVSLIFQNYIYFSQQSIQIKYIQIILKKNWWNLEKWVTYSTLKNFGGGCHQKNWLRHIFFGAGCWSTTKKLNNWLHHKKFIWYTSLPPTCSCVSLFVTQGEDKVSTAQTEMWYILSDPIQITGHLMDPADLLHIFLMPILDFV